MKHEFAEARMYNLRTVGVQGDDTSYKYATEITIKKPRQASGKKYKEEEFYSFLGRLGSRVTNEISEINRVVWVTSTKSDNAPSFFE